MSRNMGRSRGRRKRKSKKERKITVTPKKKARVIVSNEFIRIIFTLFMSTQINQ